LIAPKLPLLAKNKPGTTSLAFYSDSQVDQNQP